MGTVFRRTRLREAFDCLAEERSAGSSHRDAEFHQWIKTRLPKARDLAKIGGHSYAKGLTTVCREARCPNQGRMFQGRHRDLS